MAVPAGAERRRSRRGNIRRRRNIHRRIIRAAAWRRGADRPRCWIPTLPRGGRPPAAPPATAATPAAPPPPDDEIIGPPTKRIVHPTAHFSGLDKITGRIINFPVDIGETVQFGALQLTTRACYTRPAEEAANTDAFVEVDEVTLQGEVKRIFTGWMFASSPGLHAVEHPIYDLWLTDCRGGNQVVATDGSTPPEQQPQQKAQPKAPPKQKQTQQQPPKRPVQQLPPPAARWDVPLELLLPALVRRHAAG